MKVIYAENWEKRMEKCEKVNRENRVHFTVLRIVLLFAYNAFVLSHLFYIESMTFTKIIVFGSIFGSIVIWTCLAQSIAGLEADVSSVNRSYPFFANIADEGATVSYLLEEKNAIAVFANGNCCIEYKKQKRNKTKTEVLKLENIKIKEYNVDEPVLDLQKMELIIPFDTKKETDVSWQAATNYSSDATRKLARLKI